MARRPLRSLRMLLDEGGVLHLFDRWLALNGTPTCRLVTTAGVSGEALSLVNAAKAISSSLDGGDGQYDEIVAKFGHAIAQARQAKFDGSRGDLRPENLRESPETVIAFLSMFKVQDSQPPREYIGLMAPQAYALPVARRLGCEEAAEAIWNAVMAVVRERMRAAGRTSRGKLPSVLGARDESGFEARTISVQEVVIIVQVAIANPQGFQPLPRRVRTSRVAIKMTTGGCSDNAVERAEDLRLQYRQHWREARGTPMIKPTQRQLENTLLRVVEEATDKVRLDGIRWGRALWLEVQLRLEHLASTLGAQGLDHDLLLGGVSELSNDCRTWFSDRFDLDAEARRLTAEAT